jgi:solute:Na+ symporter, SSS family
MARNVSTIVGIFSIAFAIILIYTDVGDAYSWFNGLMGLVLGIIGGTFTLGVMTKRANAKGAICGFFATAAVAIYVSYFTDITLWAYSIINLIASIVFGYVFSLLFKQKSKAEDENLTFYDSKKPA